MERRNERVPTLAIATAVAYCALLAYCSEPAADTISKSVVCTGVAVSQLPEGHYAATLKFSNQGPDVAETVTFIYAGAVTKLGEVIMPVSVSPITLPSKLITGPAVEGSTLAAILHDTNGSLAACPVVSLEHAP